jgi:hypothetical protein
MALRKFLILRRPWSGRLEGPTALVRRNFNSFTGSEAGIDRGHGYRPEPVLGPARGRTRGPA